MGNINNDHRINQYSRYAKYILAAQQMGITVPAKYQSLDDAVNWLSKQNEGRDWQSICEEARRLFPETFQSEAQ